jgi:nudix-type nucleoside diphosphatase (YffH/AdpP family)
MTESDRVTIESEETLADNWHRLSKLRLAFRRRDGTTQHLDREVYRNGTAAAVLPHDPARDTVLLIRQFRLPPLLCGDPCWLVEACAGIVEPANTPIETARLEAEQELGCRLHALRPAFSLYTSPGATTEKLHLFLGEYSQADRTGRGGGLRAEGEDIEVLELPLAEAWAMATRGDIVDIKTVLLLQHLVLVRGS